jgi:hypothetical protein
MTFRLLGLPEEFRLAIEEASGGTIDTEAARLIVELSVREAEDLARQQIANATREIQSIVGPHGALSRVQAGGLRITPGSGMGVFLDGVYKTQIQPNGTFIIGSNIESPETTTEVFFTEDTVYNNESFGAGDYLIGDNSTGQSNMKWDASEGQLQFRGGQTVQVYMDTDGTLKAGNGNIHLTNSGIAILEGGSGQSFLSFYDSTGTIEKFAFKGGTGGMQIQSLIAGDVTSLHAKTTGGTAALTWGENPSVANALLFEIQTDTEGGRAAFGYDHFIDFLDTDGNGSATVYFNERNHDIDFLVEGDAAGSRPLHIDAGLNKATSFVWDGWGLAHEAWTRTGNHTFTVPGDLTLKYRKGAKVYYDDGAGDFGVIASSSHAAGTTTVNLIPNTDYAMAAATITDTYLSYIENPEGFPHWFNYSPTVSGSGGSAGAYAESESSCKFTVSGRMLHTRVHKVVSNVGSWTGTIKVSTPTTIVVQTAGTIVLGGALYASGATAATQLGVLYEVDTTFWTFIHTVRTAQVVWTDVAANVGIHIDTHSEI